jgi:hypothetical protein
MHFFPIYTVPLVIAPALTNDLLKDSWLQVADDALFDRISFQYMEYQ